MKKFKKLLLFLVLLYSTCSILSFISLMKKNYDLGWPMDLSELIIEKNAGKVLDDWIVYRMEFKDFDYSENERKNNEILSKKRKIFMRNSIRNYNHQYYHSKLGIKKRIRR
ncbi:unnamed protein product [Caenorhabditis angaria]|uniref:Uncharacterized protein n=1 Tax=Caenorhabditis angaria TaxID=860376 RepID=A0A9P1MWK9_9PELO|nr:unnamed protein product [Caenorhabditis angaria]